MAVKDAWIAGAGFVLGWLLSKTWSDPGCRLGLVLFLVLSAVMVLTFVLAVVGHRRKDEAGAEEDEDGEGRP